MAQARGSRHHPDQRAAPDRVEKARRSRRGDQSTEEEAVDPTREPSYRTLSRTEIDDLLARHHVGRIAYAFHDRVDVEPINYVYQDGWVYLRTAPGSKLTTLARHPWVAFEVDEVEDTFDWRSVVVHSTVYELTPGGTESQNAAYEKAVQVLRTLIPETFTGEDPVPARKVVLRMKVDEVEGRASSTSGA
jgi:nitroimidazol reductase NimA-like FMN-containing flavoprotein (pyridoxamine 5'-phosphate oxidase superfamily)